MESIKNNSVLIIEDSTVNIIALTNILGDDYNVYVSKSGFDGVCVAKNSVPDVILLDILMPGIDGFEVIRLLKSSSKTCDIPVIFVTGLNNPFDEERGLALGAADYITKPFVPAVVKLRVKNQIMMREQLRLIGQLCMTDQLTELPNRRSFDERLTAEWGRAIREGAVFSAMMIDIDKFKRYNDTYGHQQGDTALCTAGEIFKRTLMRPGDFVARWGGEEFFVLLPDTDADGADGVAEKIRAAIEKTAIPCEDGTATFLTVSIGVYTQSPVRGDSTDQLMRCVDDALYQAKQNGRNRVCHFKA